MTLCPLVCSSWRLGNDGAFTLKGQTSWNAHQWRGWNYNLSKCWAPTKKQHKITAHKPESSPSIFFPQCGKPSFNKENHNLVQFCQCTYKDNRRQKSDSEILMTVMYKKTAILMTLNSKHSPYLIYSIVPTKNKFFKITLHIFKDLLAIITFLFCCILVSRYKYLFSFLWKRNLLKGT